MTYKLHKELVLAASKSCCCLGGGPKPSPGGRSFLSPGADHAAGHGACLGFAPPLHSPATQPALCPSWSRGSWCSLGQRSRVSPPGGAAAQGVAEDLGGKTTP